jgi:hypothetical protein
MSPFLFHFMNKTLSTLSAQARRSTATLPSLCPTRRISPITRDMQVTEMTWVCQGGAWPRLIRVWKPGQFGSLSHCTSDIRSTFGLKTKVFLAGVALLQS